MSSWVRFAVRVGARRVRAVELAEQAGSLTDGVPCGAVFECSRFVRLIQNGRLYGRVGADVKW
jgi:hypothetical protein